MSSILFRRLLRPLRFAWPYIPEPLLATGPMRRLGHHIYDRYVRNTKRNQTHQTRFMRNPPQLQTLRELIAKLPPGATLRVASIGCSTGAELYTALWVLRSARRDLRVLAAGVDIAPEVVEVARRGIYRSQSPEGVRELENTGQRAVPADGIASMGDLLLAAPDGSFHVADWLREGVDWFSGDATDPQLVTQLGPRDLVLACNFMGPMEDALAESCLRNVARLVAPNGILVLDGIDLDVKSRVVPTLGLAPITERIEAAHVADPTKRDWPWTRWSHEPFDRDRPDWAFRYSTIFVRSEREAVKGNAN
jgi:chemotaxis protein methyltransferase CheR